jgi:glyoxylase-like metal-dependent hydrolase (beta-lactamase superfamily II)
MFLSDLGKGAIAVAIVGGIGAAACTDDDEPGSASDATATTAPTTPAAATTAGAAATATERPAIASATVAPVDWRRVPLGSVSAYVLARNGEAAVADTGVPGSADDIESALLAAGLGWDAVGHVILTHRHGDHAGSLPEVLSRAAGATAYAGAGDIPSITSPRPLVAVGDGDSVFDLEIIETPGHTPGHISILDAAGGLLVAGDALNGSASGGVSGPNPRFSSDIGLANASVAKLTEHAFETVVFGHGDPVVGGASAAVLALAASL